MDSRVLTLSALECARNQPMWACPQAKHAQSSQQGKARYKLMCERSRASIVASTQHCIVAAPTIQTHHPGRDPRATTKPANRLKIPAATVRSVSNYPAERLHIQADESQKLGISSCQSTVNTTDDRHKPDKGHDEGARVSTVRRQRNMKYGVKAYHRRRLRAQLPPAGWVSPPHRQSRRS